MIRSWYLDGDMVLLRSRGSSVRCDDSRLDRASRWLPAVPHHVLGIPSLGRLFPCISSLVIRRSRRLFQIPAQTPNIDTARCGHSGDIVFVIDELRNVESSTSSYECISGEPSRLVQRQSYQVFGGGTASQQRHHTLPARDETVIPHSFTLHECRRVSPVHSRLLRRRPFNRPRRRPRYARYRSPVAQPQVSSSPARRGMHSLTSSSRSSRPCSEGQSLRFTPRCCDPYRAVGRCCCCDRSTSS